MISKSSRATENAHAASLSFRLNIGVRDRVFAAGFLFFVERASGGSTSAHLLGRFAHLTALARSLRPLGDDKLFSFA
jgi:hypothetical protein